MEQEPEMSFSEIWVKHSWHLHEMFRPFTRTGLLILACVSASNVMMPSIVTAMARDWGAIFRESSRVLYEEVDYRREGRNAEKFSENFKGTEWIKAPSINWSRSTSKVTCRYAVLH